MSASPDMSSRPQLRLLASPPWAVLGAVLLLVLLEIWIRGARTGRVPYQQGEGEYRSAVVTLDLRGAPEIAVVGSSRGREAVLPKELGEALAARGCEAEVGNYALPGAHAQEVQLVARRLMEASPPPELVLYGIGPRQLLAKPRPLVNSAYLFTPREWLDARREWGHEASPLLGQVVRTQLSKHIWLLRYRPEAYAAAHADEADARRRGWGAEAQRRWRPKSRRAWDPKTGGRTRWHSSSPDQARNVGPARTREYLRKVVGEDGEYRIDPRQVARLGETLDELAASGAQTVLFGVPMSRVMRELLPADVEPEFLALMQRLAEQRGLTWLPESALSGPLPTPLFREQSHVNLPGALRWTEHLAAALPGEVLSAALPGCSAVRAAPEAPATPSTDPP